MVTANSFRSRCRFDYLELGESHVMPALTREIWFETHIAGTMYREGLTEKLDLLQPGLPLLLVGEPENPHDERAIRVETFDGMHLGYVPRRLNSAPFDLLARGGRLEAELLQILWRNHWLEILIRIDKVNVRLLF